MADIRNLNYGVLHTQIGFEDGVSIVIDQIEGVMVNYLKIPQENIFYLVGKDKRKKAREREILWHKNETNVLVEKHFQKGLKKDSKEKIEKAILKAEKEIESFVKENEIDILITHNSSHPVNFISSVALSRFYQKTKNPPKYILWWHDSHLERKRYENPAPDIKDYLLEGVPGKFVDYIIFINRLQFKKAQSYFLELDKREKGLYEKIARNNVYIYNTINTYIKRLNGLKKKKYKDSVSTFLRDFKIKNTLKVNNLKLNEVQFCLQHTRVVPRKRIDFALKYAYSVLEKIEKKAMIFFVSGPSGDEGDQCKKDLIELNKELQKKYNKKLFLIFAEDYKKAETPFQSIPFTVSRLGGFATYFSEIEGFGNNLLEILSAGLVPAIYTYPVYLNEIKEYNFELIKLKEYKITKESVNKMKKIIEKDRLRRRMARKNIKILNKHFSHKTLAYKLRKAIIY